VNDQRMKATITEITRGHVRMDFGDKSVTVEGEAYARGYGSPDFVIYQNSIRRWDAPCQDCLIDEATQREILDALKSEMLRKGIVVEVE
jgi:hypothetical protein